MSDPTETTIRYVNATTDVVRRMTDREVWLFEQGFAAYADGIPHDHGPAYENINERRWWLKGWYASRNANDGLRKHAKVRKSKKATSQTTDWQPISDAPLPISEIAHYALPPRLGHHVGRCHTLPDGRWVVIKFTNPGTEPESYFILPKPPN